jgi:hypothetical protein
MTVSGLPWARWIGSGCRCDARLPCLAHYSDLGWRDRSQALVRAGIRPAVGR